MTIGLNLTGQVKTNKEVRGDKSYFTYSYDKAIHYYAGSKELTNEGQSRLADSYYKMNLNSEARTEYSIIVNNPAGATAMDYYNYAQVLKSEGLYDESRIWMDKFAEMEPNDLRVKSYIKDNSKLADIYTDKGIYEIKKQSINTSASDFSPAYYKNSIVFSSNKKNGKLFAKKSNWTGKPFYNLYVAEIKNGQLQDAKVFNKKLNEKYNVGPASFSKDGKYMEFTKNKEKDKSTDDIVELQIYFAEFIDDKWTEPTPFNLNNKSYSVGHPSLSANGQTMYFTSDMPGGFGGADIYKVSKDQYGNWGTAENLGNKINTEGDEVFPFYEEKNGILFFSSNGLFGLGRLDVFICILDETGYTEARNAGFPLNTMHDDFAVIVNDTLSKGYFSSNRATGEGSDDIYSFNLIKNTPAEEVIDVNFYVHSPSNIPSERRVRETFPIRNYIFFDLGSTEIPDRYVLLDKSQLKEFTEENLEIFTTKFNSGRSKRQMTAYYNILNILGDRMVRNPESKITLVGSSEKGYEEGIILAESVKTYLRDIWEINSSRIAIEGRDKPKLPSEKPGADMDLDLLRQGDRRVSIESSSPEILMEFQAGPDAPLKPVTIYDVQEAPLESYVTFTVEDTSDILDFWNLEITNISGPYAESVASTLGNDISGNNPQADYPIKMGGKTQYFGPYTESKVYIPGKDILGNIPEADYTIKMIGKTKTGKTITKDDQAHLVLWTPAQDDEMMRFSILYGFDSFDAIKIYEQYLTEIIIPKIPKNGLVFISGYTDVTGDSNYNEKLSQDRANDVKTILSAGLVKAGRTDVDFEVTGYGEKLEYAPFDNKLPEERFYNRTVIIDIVPQK